MSDAKTYRAAYSCENCDHEFSHEIEFGKRAPKNVECSKCGCSAAKRKKAVIVAPREPIVIKTEPSTPSYYPVPYYVPTPAPQPYYQHPYWKQWDVYCLGGGGSGGSLVSSGNLGVSGAAGSTSCMSSGGMGISMNGGMQ